jgi:hypothetical protein
MATRPFVSRRSFLGMAAGTLAGALALRLGPLAGSRALAAPLDPGKVVRSVCEVCFWKCGIQGHAQGDRLIKIQGSPLHPLSNGKLCPRGVGGVGLAHDPDRLVKPLLRVGPRGSEEFKPVSWEEALSFIATKLDDIRECAQGAVTRNPALNQIRVVVTLRSELPRPLMQQNPPEQAGEGDGRHRTTTDERLTWAREALENLGAQHSRVRLTTYSPNDPQLRACMDRSVQPLEFPVYREMRQEFRRVIDTRAARSAAGLTESYSGMGFTTEGAELPWWLVSAPTLEVENPQPATRPGTPATPATPAQTGADAGVRPRAPADAGTARPDAGTQGTTGTSTQRPWWEE